MQAKRIRCVFSLIHLHGFLTASSRPDPPLPRLASASSMLPRPRSRENCLTHITDKKATTYPTSHIFTQ